jgi:3-hydroxypropanoate dehydrogenase
MSLAVDRKSLETILTKARSYHGWDARPVPDALLRELYDVAKMGPTTANSQPMRIVFVRTPEGKKRLEPALSSTNRGKTMAAPVTAIIAYSLDFSLDLPRFYHVPSAKHWYTTTPELTEQTALRNSSLQGAYFIIAARAVGLDVGGMSGFSNEKVDAEFFPDGRTKSNFLVNLGFGGDTKTLNPDLGRRTFDETCSFA